MDRPFTGPLSPADPVRASAPAPEPSGRSGATLFISRVWGFLNHQVAGGLVVAAIVAIAGFGGGVIVASSGATVTHIVRVPPAKCPDTLNPMALVQTQHPVANSHPASTSGLGAAHIDNVIAPDGSANVKKFETVCLTVQKYPAANRQLWLILRLREPSATGDPYDLYFVVGGLADPSPGRYSVAVDRSCTSLSAGQRHTLFVISAPPSADAALWGNYNTWLHSLNTDCNNNDDSNRHRLPNDYYIVSEQGDVIQH
jgi:hypothetical protein